MVRNTLFLLFLALYSLVAHAQFGNSDRTVANQLFRDARIFRADAAYQQSNILLRQAMQLYSKEGMWEKYCQAKSILADNFLHLELYDSVKTVQEELIAESVKHRGKNNRFEMQGYIALGEIFMKKQQYDVAYGFLNEGLNLVKGKPLGNEDLLLQIYTDIGLVHEARREYNAALHIYAEAEATLKKKAAPELVTVARFYSAYAHTLLKCGDAAKALNYAEKSQQVNTGLYTPNSYRSAETALLIAEIQESLKNPEKAEEILSSTAAMLTKVPNSTLLQLQAYRRLGLVQQTLGKGKAAESAWLEAVNIAKRSYGDKHPELGSLYALLAEVALQQRSGAILLQYIEAGERALMYSAEGGISICLDPVEMIHLLSIYQKALYHKIVAIDKKQAYEELALRVIAQAEMEMIAPLAQKNLRQNIASFSTVTALSTLGLDANAAETALQWIEIGKRSYRRSLLQISSTKTLWGLSDSLRNQEQGIRNSLSNARFELINGIQKQDAEAIESALAEWNLYSKAYKELCEKLKSTHADFYRTFCNNAPLDLKALQSKLPKGQALLIFGEAENSYLRFFIQQGNLKAAIIPRNNASDQAINELYNSLSQSNTSEALVGKNAKMLYDQLFSGIELQKINDLTQLIISADGKLWNLPFELLCETAASGRSETWAMLLKKYNIRYAWSAAELLYPKPTYSGKDFCYFGTNYKEQPNNRYPAWQEPYKSAKTWAKNLNVNAYRRALKGDFHLNVQATESEFQGVNIANFALMHLSLYGQLNEQNPLESYLLMSFRPDSLSDGIFYAWESGKYPLSLSLLSLTSLSDSLGFSDADAAFLAALGQSGTAAVLYPFWSVSEEKSKGFILRYYQLLSEGKSKSEALQMTKLEWIAKGKPMHEWAAYRLWGQDGLVQIRLRTQFPWLWLAGGLGFILLLILIWRWRRKLG